MTTPYTYLVKHIPSGRVYYGLRYAKNCNPEDLWKTYFTSSKDIKKLIDSDGKNAFVTEIRQIFEQATSAIEWEKRVLRRMNVTKRDDFINRNVPGSSMFSHSEETKAKMRKPKPADFKNTLMGNKRATVNKGIKKPEGFGKKISEKKTGKNYGRVGTNAPRYGQKKSQQELDKMSASMKSKKWMNNGANCVFVDADKILEYLELGYTLGRGSTKFKKE